MKVFISHIRKDSALADEVAKSLRELGHSVLTAGGIESRTSWRKQLEDCDAMIALLHATSYQSQWVKQEVEFGLSHERFSGRFLPVLVGRGFEEAHTGVPWILRSLQHIQLAGSHSVKRNAARITDGFKQMLSRGEAT